MSEHEQELVRLSQQHVAIKGQLEKIENEMKREAERLLQKNLGKSY